MSEPDTVSDFGRKIKGKYPELEEMIGFGESSPLQPYINYVNQLELRRTAQRGMDEYREEMQRRIRGEEKEYVFPSEEQTAEDTKVEENKEEQVTEEREDEER